jgi:hypothetical protein
MPETFTSPDDLIAAAQKSQQERGFTMQPDGGPHPLVRQLLAMRQQLVAMQYQLDGILASAVYVLDMQPSPGPIATPPDPAQDGYQTFEG